MAETVFLEKILATRRIRLEAARAEVPLDRIHEAAGQRIEYGGERRNFEAALRGRGFGIIAELKQASPSHGRLRADYRPREIAPGFEAAGAVALSVLTEEQFFLGSLGDLKEARAATRLPVLRKDFILDAYQVYESVAAGADALLLIVAALDDANLRGLIELAGQIEIAALVEVHNEEELSRAVAAGARIIGVNNRDLRTFEVNLETSVRLGPKIPLSCVAVSESGIGTAAEVALLREAGFDAALIGERLMSEADPGRALAELIGESRSYR